MTKQRFTAASLAREYGLPEKQARAKLRRHGFGRPYLRKHRAKYVAVLTGRS